MKTKTTLFTAVLAIVFSILSYAQVRNIAHRGCSSLAPENTYSAWVKAIETNADYFELDIQLSSDDSLIIMHDDTVDRTTNGTGLVSSMTYAQLRLLDAGSWFGPEFTGEQIPTFSEALQLAKTDGTIDIVAEIKSTDLTIVPKVVEMIQAFGMQNRVIVSSFTSSQITICKSLDPSIDIQLFGTINNAMIDQVANINGEWVGSGGTITQSLIDYAHSKDVLFNAWTINSASQMLPLIAMGIDGITTNFPQVLSALIDSTGPSDVVVNSAIAIGETDITLDWQAATDPESGIAGYEIYRDITPGPTTLYTTVGDTTNYSDHTFTETQTFYYRLKAVNSGGIKSENFSNEVSATTGTDVTKPVVTYVTSNGDTSNVVVEFSEKVDHVTAETITNYTINKSVVVLNAKMALDQKQVFLTTTQMADTTYTLTVKNVNDLAITPNVMVTSSTIFWHRNISADVVAYYNLDDTQIVGVDTLIIDVSANANNGVFINGPVIVEGFLGNALHLDGIDDYVQFAQSPSFDISSGLVSLSVWVKLVYLPSELPGAFGPIFDSETDQYVIYEDRGNNQLRFKVTSSGGAARPAIQAADLKTGEWINVVGVYDGANAKIYLNGVFKNSLPLTGTVNPGQVATLGKSGTTFFSGEIDNVQVFNKALTDQEVADLYANSKTMGLSPNPSDVILNASVVDETDVILSWNPSINYESTLMGYEIYRDAAADATTLIATVEADKTEYIDATNEESQTFYYRVRAKNSLALLSINYSNEVTATTTTDTKSPKASYITSREENTKVVVEFSELVDMVTSETSSNYSIDNSISVLSSELLLDEKTVILKTSPMSVGDYNLTISNITDIAAASNVIPTSIYSFSHTGFPTNLVAYYSMDQTRVDTLFDASINGNNGVFMNGTSIDKGYSGNSLIFNGVDNYVQFDASTSFDISSGIVSVSSWVKLDYLPTEMTQPYGPVFDSQGDQYVIYADRGNRELRFKAATTGGAARPGIPQAELITGKWINVVGVYDGTNAMIYLNGVMKGILPLTGTINPGQVAMLGKSGTTGTPAYLKGNIDFVAIFDKALSESEISEMYNNYKVPSDLVVSVGEGDDVKIIPTEFAIHQNYPNPFNPSTTIKYDLPITSKVVIKVYDILGSEIASLVDEVKEAGFYKVVFNGNGLASGIYFFRIQADKFVQSKKMILMK